MEKTNILEERLNKLIEEKSSLSEKINKINLNIEIDFRSLIVSLLAQQKFDMAYQTVLKYPMIGASVYRSNLLDFIDEEKKSSTLLLSRNIGKKVIKKSGNPFKSKLTINTIKDVIEHPIIKVPAFTFEEDDSYVEVRNCLLADSQ